MKLTTTKLTLLLLLMLVGCTADATPTPEPEQVTLKLSWQHGVQFLGFYIAQEQGFYAEEGLVVTIEPLLDIDEAITILEGVSEGVYDFGLGGELLASGQLNEVPLIAVASILQLSPTAFFARADSGITTPADFAGRRIVVKNDGWQVLLEALLAHGGLTLDDIEAVPGGFDMTPFIEGDVEIWAGFLNDEVVLARQHGLDLVTFPLYEYRIESITMPIFTSQALLENEPDRVRSFVQASLQGWLWAVENPTEAVDVMLERYPELVNERDFYLASFDAYIPLMRPSGVQIGSIDCEQWISNERFDVLDSRDGLCTTDIFEQAVAD